MSEVFRKEAKSAYERGALQLSQVLHLLQAICDLTHSPNNSVQPFGPMIVLDGKRSWVPDDLNSDQTEMLASLVAHLQTPLVSGRVADVLWLQSQPRNHDFALMAIDSYMRMPITGDSWFDNQQDNWHRAAVLCRLLGRGAGDRASKLEASLLAAIANARAADKYLASALANVLDAHGLGKSNAKTVATHLEALAHQFAEKADFTACFDYYREAGKWYQRAGEGQQAIGMTIQQADSCVKQAEATLEADDSNHMIAAIHLEKAVQILQTAPRASRKKLAIDTKIRELRLRLSEYNQQALNELKTVSFELDITELANNARNAVKGRTLLDALAAFGSLIIFRVDDFRQQESRTLEDYPLQTLFSSITYSSDGRVSNVSSGLTVGDLDSYERALEEQMLRSYGRAYVAGNVTAIIQPALEVLRLEHRIREEDFVTLTRNSTIVPIGRERLFAKALWSGYCGDFPIAVHLLTPQIEHLVRSRLKSARVLTTLHASNGVETEKSLSALMDMQETEDLLGADLSFEIRAIFCEALGGNLRNDVAHGLLDDQESQSYWTVYAWWLALKIVFGTYMNALVASKLAADSNAESVVADESSSNGQ